MKKITFVMLLGILAFQAGCAETLRYSVDEISTYTPEIQERIKNGEIATGMTKLQVRYSWGGPETSTVLSPSADGKDRVEWTYRRYGIFSTRLVFTEGILREVISTEPGIAK